MKKRTALVFLLLQLSYGLYAQRKEQLINALKTQNTISGVLACLDTFWIDIRPEPFKSPINFDYDYRRIDFDFRYKIINKRGDPFTVTEYFRLNIVSSNDSVKYLSIQENPIHYGKNVTENILFIDVAAIDSLVGFHNKKFRSQFDKYTFLKNLFINDELAFGCSESGQYYSKTAIRFIRFIKNKNKDALLRWLQSPSAEEQACGIIGLYDLAKMGIPITESEQQIINYIYSINPSVEYCSGCIIGLHRPIKEYTLRGH